MLNTPSGAENPMKIQTRGKPEKITIAEIKQAAEWYAHKLMGTKLSNNITIRVVFKKDFLKSKHTYAECDALKVRPNPRRFQINIDAEMGRRSTLLCLAHEMVHVKQFARNELVELKENVLFRWNGELYGEEIHYYEQPWEIEAYGRELGLYCMWQESLLETA